MTAIPKVGNLRLPDNHRCIQMQRLLSHSYDRFICNRLLSWAKENKEQTAQKGKSTIDQLFLMRILTSLINSAHFL